VYSPWPYHAQNLLFDEIKRNEGGKEICLIDEVSVEEIGRVKRFYSLSQKTMGLSVHECVLLELRRDFVLENWRIPR